MSFLRSFNVTKYTVPARLSTHLPERLDSAHSPTALLAIPLPVSRLQYSYQPVPSDNLGSDNALLLLKYGSSIQGVIAKRFA